MSFRKDYPETNEITICTGSTNCLQHNIRISKHKFIYGGAKV
jgi:hypothetical protein